MASNYIKQDILEQLKSGNTSVLKGMPPVTALAYGLAVKDEEEKSKDSYPFDNEAMGKFILKRNEPIAEAHSVTFFKKNKEEQ